MRRALSAALPAFHPVIRHVGCGHGTTRSLLTLSSGVCTRLNCTNPPSVTDSSARGQAGVATSSPPPAGADVDNHDGAPQEQQQRQRHKRTPRGGLRLRARRRDARRTSPKSTSRAARVEYADAVPRSLDTSAVEDLLDVERFFPRAVAHLKAVPLSPNAAEESRARRWHDATHDYNADHIGTPTKAAVKARQESGQYSFFDEGSLDVRGGMADKIRSGHVGGARDETERLSPDVLQLTGGSARRHGGHRLSSGSNQSPADQTIEGDRGDPNVHREFGDTPPQLTDMLRERLMELKAETLREERNETYLPQRLRHVRADEALLQLAQRGDAPSPSPPQPMLLKREEGRRGSTGATSLADLVPGEERDEEEAPRYGSSPYVAEKAILRDGVAPDRVATAAEVVRGSDAFVPGASAHDPLQRLAAMAANEGRHGSSAHGQDCPQAQEGIEGPGRVHLLRTLSRAGFCSRREAAAIIASGQVRVNNVVERNPFRVVGAEDDLHVAGHESRLRFAPPRLWVYHKPANVIVSRNDVAGRTLITKHARILGMDHLVPVGSLPMRAHGILLLTNDGELSRFLENPKSMVQRTYLLRVRPAMDPVLVHKLNTEGIHLNGRRYKDAEFFVNPATKSRYSVKVKVRGETMPIAHLMQHIGRTIERGGRLSFGPFALSNLAVGSLREVTVPPFYMEHLGSAWKPFVERDWPYFRRQRVARLRCLCRYRELTPKELEELDNYTYEEVKDALTFESTELEALAEQRAQQLRRAQHLEVELPPLPRDFMQLGKDGDSDVATDGDIPYDDTIVEDITRVL